MSIYDHAYIHMAIDSSTSVRLYNDWQDAAGQQRMQRDQGIYIHMTNFWYRGNILSHFGDGVSKVMH